MGLPTRVVIPLLAVFAVVFLGIMAYFLRIGFATEGSAFGTSAPHEQGDSRIAATPAPLPPIGGGDASIPQSGSGPNALPGNQVGGGGPPAPVMAALTGLQARVAKNPRDTQSLVALGTMYYEAGKYDQALTYNQRALAVDHKLAAALFAKAMDLQGMGKRAEAIRAYKDYLRVVPNDPRAADKLNELNGPSK
jgi:tetratricopeptide (TPR) repeat protein